MHRVNVTLCNGQLLTHNCNLASARSLVHTYTRNKKAKSVTVSDAKGIHSRWHSGEALPHPLEIGR